MGRSSSTRSPRGSTHSTTGQPDSPACRRHACRRCCISAIAAGRDAQTAAVAATDTRRIATEKRKAELAEAIRKAVEEAKAIQASGSDPANSTTHDRVNLNATSTEKAAKDEWWNDAGW